jgi:hypothetical protein
MSSLFNQSGKAFLEGIMAIAHDTMVRPIIIYRKDNEVKIYDSPQHDFIYNYSPTNSPTINTPVSGLFNARIQYGQKQPLDFFESILSRKGQDQVNIRKDDGTVRLKVDISGSNFLEGAQRITLDGMIFVFDGGKRPHGLFSPQYYTYVLKKQN